MFFVVFSDKLARKYQCNIRISASTVTGSTNEVVRNLLLTLLLSLSAGSAAAAPFAYSVNSNGIDAATSDSLHRIDLATGDATRLNKVRLFERQSSDIEGLAFGPDNILYGADDADETLITIDTETGIGTSVAGNPFNMRLVGGQVYDFGMTFTCDGALLLSSDDENSLYQLDTKAGNATIIGAGATLNVSITALAAWGNKVYGLSPGRVADQLLTPSLYEINASTGKATLVGPLGTQVKLYRNGGLAFDAEGQLWAITDRFNIDQNNTDFPSQIIKIDPTTGQATAIAESPVIGFESLAITGPMGCTAIALPTHVRAVPIPVLNPLSILLMALVLLLVGGFNIRFKAG